MDSRSSVWLGLFHTGLSCPQFYYTVILNVCFLTNECVFVSDWVLNEKLNERNGTKVFFGVGCLKGLGRLARTWSVSGLLPLCLIHLLFLCVFFVKLLEVKVTACSAWAHPVSVGVWGCIACLATSANLSHISHTSKPLPLWLVLLRLTLFHKD